MTLPLILVPGHLCGPWLYAPQLGAFGGPRPIILADTFSDDTVAGMADRLIAAAPERFVLAGLSMGGMVAMEVMARAPARVAGACLMDTDPMPARAKECDWRQGLLAQGMAAYIATFVERFYLHDTEVAAALGPLTRGMMGQTPEDVARAQAQALDTRREMIPLIGGYRGPVEIIVGADDRVCPPRLHGALSEALPDATLTEIPKCGHIATLEHPEAVNARIFDLLERAA